MRIKISMNIIIMTFKIRTKMIRVIAMKHLQIKI